MKLTASVLGIMVFFVAGIVCFNSYLTGWALLSWFVSSLCVTLSLMAHRAREAKRYEDKDEEERMIKELERQLTPARIRRVPDLSGGYYYYDDAGEDITDLFLNGQILYDYFFCEEDDVDGPYQDISEMGNDMEQVTSG